LTLAGPGGILPTFRALVPVPAFFGPGMVPGTLRDYVFMLYRMPGRARRWN
jgi:ABC-type proline/glycine betaine transport system permease subunit